MKEKIHPNVNVCKVTCTSCGHTFETLSTMKEIRVDTCAECHPFYTGNQKIVDTEGRIEKFKKRYQQKQN